MKTLVLALLLTPALAAQLPLCDQLRNLTSGPTVASAHWGVQVTDIHGAPLCSINEAQLFRPASNNKIFTTATALALLGPDHTLITRLEAEGELKDGTLHGNLVLIGVGDANFGAHNIPYLAPAARPKDPVPEPSTLADIEAFADAVAARGIRTITGDIVGDDTYFAWQPYPPDWEIDDTIFGYGAPISALTIHDNAIDFTVSSNPPTAAGSASASVTFIPAVPYYQLNVSVYSMTVAGGCDDRLSYLRAAGSKALKIVGAIAPGATPCQQAIAIQDPAEYAALALKLALERHGIRTAGSTLARHYDAGLLGGVHAERPDHDPTLTFLFGKQLPTTTVSCEAQRVYTPGEPAPLPRTLLATHTSPTLLQDITYTNKVSQNQHAELLLRSLGPTFTCQNTQRDGLHIVREYLLHAGVNPQDIALYDGSGLSTHDLVAPRALTTFLAYAATQPWFQQFKSSLPQGGVDGGLVVRFKDMPPGRLFAKTGTLGESRALSGYLTTASGQQLIFSIMVDDHLPNAAGPPPDRVIMDRMVQTIAASN